MAFIRDRREELTGYQEQAVWDPRIDLNIDFVMVYGNDPTLYQRIKTYRSKGYRVHLMTGAAWGNYQDYLYGRADGKTHWDESQTRANGEVVGHGEDIPYLVPAVSFADYLTGQLKKAVDAGVEAIHLEEPEFWDYSGYSKAFKEEYQLFYRKPWQDPTTSLEALYKAAKLKAYLYQRLIRRCADAVKEYSLRTTGKVVRMYVPTHSLVNYSTWKIMSPEGLLNEIDSLDGFIAQVWTGTSREPNYYRGKLAEHTFETAYCEFSVMQELVRGTDKRMWFLADPVEDNPRYSWPDYQKSYFETITASLLHPAVHHYEVTPWPSRVFEGKYPANSPEAKPIPETYRTQLSNMYQTLGNMDQSKVAFDENNDIKLGVGLSDTAMYQRSYPDFDKMPTNGISQADLKRYSSMAFPMFYGLAMPLVKHGLPLRVVQIDNALRLPGYFDSLNYLVLSYDFMKPKAPAINSEIAAWVRRGGTLIYVGSEKDPYNSLPEWWNDSGKNQQTPLDHLLHQLGLSKAENAAVGAGRVFFFKDNPDTIDMHADVETEYLVMIDEALQANNETWTKTNNFTLHRGPYVVSASMTETKPTVKTLVGKFADLHTPDFRYVQKVTVAPGENALLYDLTFGSHNKPVIIGSTARVLAMTGDASQLDFKLKTTKGMQSYLALSDVDLRQAVVTDAKGQVLASTIGGEAAQHYVTIGFVGDGAEVSVELTK